MADRPRARGLLATIGPGLLVAATGVGAGDLLTASLGGSAHGVGLVWAALLGGLLKWSLNEGIARWQMATGTTLLEGWASQLGRPLVWVFLAYFLGWSFFTGGALVSACGVAGSGLFPLGAPTASRTIWGVIHSLGGLALVRAGGFRAFEWVMSLCVAIMFASVLVTALLVRPDWAAVARGLVPTIPHGAGAWVLGILGGVGGTVTLLSYGYWIRESKRSGAEGLRVCRIDLGLAYVLTGLFGAAMVIIGSRVALEGSGDGVALSLAGELARSLGPAGRWVFLLGFWAAVFTSLLGVWQGVPYLFADLWRLARGEASGAPLQGTRAYRGYLVAIAIVPLPLLLVSVRRAQLVYAILGSLFMPLLAVTLLLLNNRSRLVGELRARTAGNALLVTTLLFFLYAGGVELVELVRRLAG